MFFVCPAFASLLRISCVVLYGSVVCYHFRALFFSRVATVLRLLLKFRYFHLATACVCISLSLFLFRLWLLSPDSVSWRSFNMYACNSLACHIVLPDTLCLLHCHMVLPWRSSLHFSWPIGGLHVVGFDSPFRICLFGLCTLHGLMAGLHVVGFSSCTLHGPLAGYMLSALTIHLHKAFCLCTHHGPLAGYMLSVLTGHSGSAVAQTCMIARLPLLFINGHHHSASRYTRLEEALAVWTRVGAVFTSGRLLAFVPVVGR